MFICTRVVTCVEFQYWPEFSINQDLGESELELDKYLEGGFQSRFMEFLYIA